MVLTYNIGPYKIGSTLGVGTFGKVKLAVHEVTGQKVAIKIINKSKMQSMDMHEKIRREINILQLLYHPHVIRLYELLDTPTDIFMVMEYVPGGELFDHIVQKARLSEHDARRFFQQIVSGVEYCHQHMVCHRDLKPENVLLDTNMNVKVGDFGLSNFMRDGDFLKTSCGSPNYASPEVVSGKAYAGPEVDVWSCGVILYALLCGSLPFDDEHVPNLFKKIKHGNFTLPGHLSESSRSLIVRMLVVDPAKRITFKEIRRHPWFRQFLPQYISSPVLQNPALSPVDPFIVDEMKQLGYDVEVGTVEVNTPAGKFPSRETVAYQLLADKRAKQSSFSNVLKQQGKEMASVFSKEMQKKVAVAYHLDTPAACNPDSVCPIYQGYMGGNISRHCASPLQMQSTTPLDYSPGNPQWASSRWKLGVESVLDSSTLLTAILNTLKALNYAWYMVSPYHIRCRPVKRPGGPPDSSTSSSSSSSSASYNENNPSSDSANKNVEKNSPDSSASSGGGGGGLKEDTGGGGIYSLVEELILSIHLYKIASCRYLIDVQLFGGPTITCMSEALWVTSAVYSALTQIQHQQTPSGSMQPTWSPTTPIILNSVGPSQRLFG